MNTEASLDILKEAILLERRGHAFYKKVADQAQNPAVKEFFDLMAQEEVRHMQILSDQYKAFTTEGHFADVSAEADGTGHLADKVMSDDLKRQIAGADFEAASISAAMLMEQRAVDLYDQRAELAKDPNEAALYHWLADWEQEHLAFLASLDREIKDRIWNDNSFWPF